ncbi:uncharacterized protein RJT20DRAFT_6900 [Scheffersomyces xylosifermentans]|uniref:uncharacterized protein n=1 Tax=Scheffersomyces xylosifermentans TaxID=1304137 RepID=UPI00315CCB5B
MQGTICFIYRVAAYLVVIYDLTIYQNHLYYQANMLFPQGHMEYVMLMKISEYPLVSYLSGRNHATITLIGVKICTIVYFYYDRGMAIETS